MTFVDHVAEARKLQGVAQGIISDNPTAFPPHMAAVILLDEARLEAQLAVAEQQRIANLLAFHDISQRQSQIHMGAEERARVERAGAEIREGLGLA